MDRGITLQRAVLAALGFAVATAYLPGVIDPAGSARWAILGIGVPLALLAHGGRIPAPLNGWGLTLILALGASALHAWFASDAAGLDAGYEYAHLVILAAAFCLGARAPSLRPAWAGIGAGVLLSSLIGIAQVSGAAPALEAIGIATSTAPNASGLFMNKNMLAEAGMVALIPAAIAGWWVLAAGAIAAVVLGGSKAVWLAIGIVTIAGLWRTRRVAALLAMMVGAAGVLAWAIVGDHGSLEARILFWGYTLADPRIFGHGLAAFSTNHPWVMYAHSEYLQAFYEIGILAAVPAVIALRCLYQEVTDDNRTEHLTLVALLVVAALAFPFHLALTAFAAAIAAGRLAALRSPERGREHQRAAAHQADRAEGALHANGGARA